jgi:hypothetical protein
VALAAKVGSKEAVQEPIIVNNKEVHWKVCLRAGPEISSACASRVSVR